MGAGAGAGVGAKETLPRLAMGEKASVPVAAAVRAAGGAGCSCCRSWLQPTRPCPALSKERKTRWLASLRGKGRGAGTIVVVEELS
jgi:hypothetical protein